MSHFFAQDLHTGNLAVTYNIKPGYHPQLREYTFYIIDYDRSLHLPQRPGKQSAVDLREHLFRQDVGRRMLDGLEHVCQFESREQKMIILLGELLCPSLDKFL